MAAIAIVSGVIVGPIYADLIVGTWFYKRGKRKRDAELAIKLAAIKAEGERRQEEIRAGRADWQLQRKEEDEARRNAEEQSIAIRNHFREQKLNDE